MPPSSTPLIENKLYMYLHPDDSAGMLRRLPSFPLLITAVQHNLILRRKRERDLLKTPLSFEASRTPSSIVVKRGIDVLITFLPSLIFFKGK